MRALITNGGAHPPEKWAAETAEQICPFDPSGDNTIAAKRLQLAITELLVGHHGAVQESENGHLASKGDARLDEAHDPMPAAEAALEAVIAAYKGTPFESKTEDPEWRASVGGILASHFATSVDISRQWHCHRNPSEKAKAFLAAKAGV